LALALTGLPALPLVGLSSACGLLSWSLSRGRKRESQVAAQRQVQEQRQSQAKPEPKPEDSLLVDPMELDLGVALIRLADVGSGGDLLERVTKVRNKIAQELGIILPKVRIRDNVMLEQRQYQIKIHGVPVAWGEVYAEGVLAIDTGSAVGKVMGVQTTEPAFGWPAVWIETAQKERAELMGYRVVEPSAVIATHLTEVVRKHSDELLSRQQVHQLLDNLKQSSPKVVEDLIPEMLKVPQLHQILGNLLRERVPIRNLDIILETLSDFADRTKDLGILTEYVRHGLSRSICQQYRDKSRVLHVVTLDPGLEDLLTAGIDYTERGMMVKLSPQVVDAVTRGLSQQLERLKAAGHPLVVLCSPQIRAGLKQITSSALPLLAVLSLNEVTRDTEVESVGQVGTEAVRGGVMAGAR
jgi:flagellar biosynthesis protein FlhA